MEEWSVTKLEHIPTANEFSSEIEPRNIPAVFRRCVSDWPAINKWNPNTGGLDYLRVQVGSSMTEAMVSQSGPIFYGDIRRHDRVSISFNTFIDLCKRSGSIQRDAIDERHDQDGCHILDCDSAGGLSSYLEGGSEIYLAQVPLFNKDKKGEFSMEVLLEDIYTPRFLGLDAISNINLWMNATHSRSSTHYDPHHNLLCVIAGRKQVVLWPPSATQFLYPMPVYGEASNHSAVNFVQPDIKVHPRAKNAWDHCQKVELHAGDTLYIPEGWFHQVDSDDLTIAVNYWWPSRIMLSMQTHMDAYYLRRIISRLVDHDKERMIKEVSFEHDEEETNKIYHNVEAAENKYAGPMDTGQCTSLTSFDKEKSRSLLQGHKWKSGSDRKVSSSEECCMGGVRSMEQNESKENSLIDVQSSMVADNSFDDTHFFLPQEIPEIVDKEQNCGTIACQSGDLKPWSSSPSSTGCNPHGVDSQNIYVLQKLNAFESNVLNAFVSNVHAKIGGAVQIHPESVKLEDQSTVEKERSASEFVRCGSSVSEHTIAYSVGDDTVAKILMHLKPSILKKLLLVMVVKTQIPNKFSRSHQRLDTVSRRFDTFYKFLENQFPRTLEAFVIHGLSPTAAEILTRKFDQIDKEDTKYEQEEFYRLFYTVFDDQHAAMEAILNAKECFAFLALKNVMELYLGLNCEWPKS